MKLTAHEIATVVEGTLHGSPDILITGAAGLSEAAASDISFLGNSKYLEQLSKTAAGVVLVPASIEEPDRPVIKVKNPQFAFAKILHIIEQEQNPAEKSGIHSTAIVSSTASIGPDVVIGPYAVIEDGVAIGARTKVSAHCFIGRATRIGDDCFLYPRVTVRNNISIGSRVIIHPGVVIGADGFGFVPGATGHFKIPQIGTVEIGDDVEIGANTTIDRATTDKTRIGKGTKIDNLVMIAHNVQVGEHCFICAQAGIAGSTKIGNFVTMAGQAGITGHATVGDGATLAAKSGVIGNVAPKEVVSGYPARPHREALKIQALLHRLPEIYERIKKLTKE